MALLRKSSIDPKSFVFDAGKYGGKTLDQVAQEDPGYLRWAWGLEGITDEQFYAIEDALKKAGHQVGN